LIRYSDLTHPVRVATLRQKIQAETAMRKLLRENGMPEPDGVEYGHGCIRLFFEEPKVALVVDIDDPSEDDDDCEVDPDQAVYAAEAENEYDGGYPLEGWEPNDAELN
jgi:hypothetical protein